MYHKRIKIHDTEGYQTVQARVQKGSQYLEGKWLDPQYKPQVELYEALCQALLEWEIDHDLLPKELL